MVQIQRINTTSPYIHYKYKYIYIMVFMSLNVCYLFHNKSVFNESQQFMENNYLS